MTYKRQPPSEMADKTFDQSLAHVGEFLGFFTDESGPLACQNFANAIETDPFNVATWVRTPQQLGELSREIPEFDYEMFLFRKLIQKLNILHEKLVSQLGSEAEVESMLERPWNIGYPGPSLKDIAATTPTTSNPMTGLEKACVHLEDFLVSLKIGFNIEKYWCQVAED